MSIEIGQTPLVMVHKNKFDPRLNPVIPELGNPGVVIDPPPERTVHVPIPTNGIFPFNVEIDVHIVESFPAIAGVANVLTVTTMVSNVGTHVPFEMVQRNSFIPILKPVIVVVGKVGFVIIPVPETIVHKPVPTIGVLAFKVVAAEQIRKSAPAFAIVG